MGFHTFILFLGSETKYRPYFEIVTDGNSTTYVCRLCEYTAPDVARIIRHIPSHHLHQISCPHCNLFFRDPAKREVHISECQTDAKSTVYCEPCQRDLKNQIKYRSHVRMVHTKIKCTLCPEMLLRKEILEHSKKLHGDAMPTCGVCGLKAVNRESIVKHQRMVHLKEKNVTCEICKSEFFNMNKLKRHMVNHRVEKFYECKFCQKKFPRQTAMRIHELIHLGVKKKVCSECGASFVQKASLNYHMTKHHPGVV